MQKILITGGEGDIAKAIKNLLIKDYQIFSPGKKELDVKNINSVKSFFLTYGFFDIVINNAGSIHPKTILESDEESWLNDIMVNLVGAYYVTKKNLELNNSAIIINVSSTAAYAAYKDWSSYCSSKAGLVTFTKSIANDGFKAYGIAPGAVNTKFRNYFNLSNDNNLNSQEIAIITKEIIDGKYQPGNIIFIRKGEKKIL